MIVANRRIMAPVKTDRRIDAETQRMKLYRLLALTLLLGAALVWPDALRASESNGTRAAKARFAQGDAAVKAGTYEQAAEAFREAMRLDRDFVEAHKRFIETTRQAGRDDPEQTNRRLLQLYEGWAKSYPQRAVYRWALGFLSEVPAKAEGLFREAVRIDPAFARAHFSLARHADLGGDWNRQRQHLRAAVDSNPADPQYLVQYARAYKHSDPDRFRELALSVVDKFPTSQTAAEALYQLADASSGQERRGYLERLRGNYPADRFSYSPLAMAALYSEVTDPKQALLIAQDMVRWVPTSKTWARRAAFQEALGRAQTLMAEEKFADALTLLEKTEPSSINPTRMLMISEAAAGSGQVEKAYDALADRVAAEPDDRLEAALLKHGSALKKTPQEIAADVWRIRDSKATSATPFELAGYADGKPVKLSDYRGRVVLLSFWFPG
jgi:tetratricopeptide (TPR) repeat protein